MDRGGLYGKLVSGGINLMLRDRIPLPSNTCFILVFRPPCTSLSRLFITYPRSLLDPKAAYAVFQVILNWLQDPEAYPVSQVNCLINLLFITLKH